MTRDDSPFSFLIDATLLIDTQPIRAGTIDLVARQDEFLCEELPPESIVVLLAEDKGCSPRSDKEPAGIVVLHRLRARHAVAFSQGEHLRRVLAVQEIELLLEGAVLRWCVVLVACHDIDKRVAWVPVIIVEFRSPDVDEVVHAALHQVSLRV